ncbi:c-type cytochrome [Mangrovicoccus sp. HB161399]|uniref:c-type cytochrome n=1 Tax=Mangrovicoccus sp. HB161399 TaxID=2720392 RepID=UPI001555A3CA|nr:c-type cytochrome [Mangrovicoccus sp. HB161399]
MRARDLAAALVLGFAAAQAGAWEMAEPQERCALCHGYFGDDPRPKFPKLAGQQPGYLEAQIDAFLGGHRANDGGQMAKTVTEIAPEDIPQVVEWFAAQDPPAADPPDDPALAGRGALVYAVSGCGECHDAGPGLKPATPLLTAQHPAYLAKQLRDFRSGARAMPDRLKRQAVEGLDETDIDAVAAWLGAAPRE